ncbi:YqgE/AlgH family protein [Oleispirillum naphthae]|uniref:YqgE/AlgH family protein n=1 Tax=Oleispirillum naphthae TaxID=2838853 RepID=UPI003082589C
MAATHTKAAYLTGQCLIAMPGMQDPRFEHTVVYLCAHSGEGAMGLILNRELPDMPLSRLMEQLNVPATPAIEGMKVHFGGPVDPGRGFVLHSSDFMAEASMLVDSRHALTATMDILRAVAEGRGPRQSLLALGYAGWGAGQLDAEIKDNAWLIVPADDALLFGPDNAKKWQRAIEKLGIDVAKLSSTAGNA